MTQHNGLPVAGYKPQSDLNVAMVNVNKELEERVLRQIDAMSIQRIEPSSLAPSGAPAFDPRMIAIARTSIQEGFMWLNRAVFQPGRVKLSDDQ